MTVMSAKINSAISWPALFSNPRSKPECLDLDLRPDTECHGRQESPCHGGSNKQRSVLPPAPMVQRRLRIMANQDLTNTSAAVQFSLTPVSAVTHLLEPTNNARFISFMDQFMPKWQTHRQNLNRLRVRHETWDY